MFDRVSQALGGGQMIQQRQPYSRGVAQALAQSAFSNDPIETPIEGVGRLAQLYGLKNMERSRMDAADQERAATMERYSKIAEALGGGDPRLQALISSGDPELAKMGVSQAFSTPKDTRTTDQKNWEAAQENPEFGEWYRGNKRAGATNVTVDNQFGGDKFAEEASKFQANMFGKAAEDGMEARQTLAQVEVLEGLARQFESGGGAALKSFAGDMGIATDGLDEIQAFKATVQRMVPDQLPPGVASDTDIALAKESLPRLINQPGGNALIVETLRGIANYRVQYGNIAMQAMNGEISREEAMQQINSLPNPFERLKTGLNSTGSDGASALKQKYGLE